MCLLLVSLFVVCYLVCLFCLFVCLFVCFVVSSLFLTCLFVDPGVPSVGVLSSFCLFACLFVCLLLCLCLICVFVTKQTSTNLFVCLLT